MICSSCGNNNEEQNRFCISCGNPLLPANAEPALTQSTHVSKGSPVLLLKVAKAFLGEYIKTGSDSVDAPGHLQRLIESLKDLQLVVPLSNTAASIDPSVKLDDGTTPASIKASVLFQGGLTNIRQKKFHEAITNFEESFAHDPDPANYYNIGLCFLDMKKPEDAVVAFQKCIKLDPEAETAIKAGKELARLGRLI